MKSATPTQPLEHTAYLSLRRNAQVIEKDGYGDKVLLLPDGTYLKLFRRKRLLTSAAWKPYARRFVENAAALARVGIPVPTVIAHYRIASISRDAVHYHPLPGRTIRQAIAAGLDMQQADELREKLLKFIHQLHNLGVFFRSAHLGNIVLTPDNTLGLIDISDLRITWFRIGPFRQRRNMKHVMRYREDREWLMLSPEWSRISR